MKQEDVIKAIKIINEPQFTTMQLHNALGLRNAGEASSLRSCLYRMAKVGTLEQVGKSTFTYKLPAAPETTASQPKPIDMDNLSLTETGQAIYMLLKKQDKKICDLHEELNYAVGENAELEQTIRKLQERLHECNEQLTKAGQGSKRFSLHELQSHVNGGKK